MYVDDRVGVSHVDDAVKVQLIAQESLVDVFNGGLIWLKNQSPIFLFLNPDALSVPINSVVQSEGLTIDYRATTDAANSIGLVVYNILKEVVLVKSYELPFSAHGSSFQNAKEFMGLLLAMMLIKIKFNPPRGTTLAL